MANRVLIYEADVFYQAMLTDILKALVPRAELWKTQSLHETQLLASQQDPEVFILNLPPDQLGLELLGDLKTSHPTSKILFLNGGSLPADFEKVARLNSVHFLNKPFKPEQAANMLRWLLNLDDENNGHLYQARLQNVHLLDILQLKCMAGATTVLELESEGDEPGRIYFGRGQIYHACVGALTGVAAFHALLRRRGGQIREVSPPDAPPRSIDKDLHLLLLEAARVMDEQIIMREPLSKPGNNQDQGSARAIYTTDVGDDSSEQLQNMRKFLVVDDSPLVLRYVEDVLTRHFPDFAVIMVETGREGVDCARTYIPDLILLDYVLPDFNGNSFCAELRKDPGLKDVPVILMSGYYNELNESNPNVVAALEKPFSEKVLLDNVRAILDRKETEWPQPEMREEVAAGSVAA